MEIAGSKSRHRGFAIVFVLGLFFQMLVEVTVLIIC
jgi:hypothetical protein